MKKLFFSTLLILMIQFIVAAQITVGVGQDYPTIQQAIDNASNGDEIIVYNGTYGAIDYSGLKLNIHAHPSASPSIVDNTVAAEVVNMSTASDSRLAGFYISGAATDIGVFVSGIASIDIEDCHFEGLGKAIQIQDHSGGAYPSVDVHDCTFENNTWGLYIIDDPSIQSYNVQVDVSSCNFFDNTTAIYTDGCSGGSTGLEVFYCLMYNNGSAFAMSNRTVDAFIHRTTITDNTYGFEWDSYAYFEIISSIVHNNRTNFSGTPASLDIEYSCIEGGYSGVGNIDEDPHFYLDYPFKYWLMEGSPCIDTGDPAASGGDVRIDMGSRESVRDIKKCKGEHWNWVSYPRLYRERDESVDVVPLLENFLDWPFTDLSLYCINGPALEYDGYYWDPTSYNVISTNGYKIYTNESGDHYLPTVNFASRLSSSQTIDLTDEGENWIGYWLPYTQNIRDAFGDFWRFIHSVEAEDWYYEWDEEETPTSSTDGKEMVYGKGYIVTVFESIEDFYWAYFSISERSSRPESQHFTFNFLPSYEAVDVLDIPEDVVEIGVFEDDVCVGAVVVQNEDEQILAYTSGQYPVSFEVVTGSRQANQQIHNYNVMNKKTGLYENRTLISGRQKHSVIMFGNPEDPQNDPPSLDQVVLHGNYPNPFNPETTISFNLTTEGTSLRNATPWQAENTELMIYNMKGQKVKQLFKGHLKTGEYSFTWNGTDDEGKPVSSGLYLYKLKVGDQEFSKKMLLLK